MLFDAAGVGEDRATASPHKKRRPWSGSGDTAAAAEEDHEGHESQEERRQLLSVLSTIYSMSSSISTCCRVRTWDNKHQSTLGSHTMLSKGEAHKAGLARCALLEHSQPRPLYMGSTRPKTRKVERSKRFSDTRVRGVLCKGVHQRLSAARLRRASPGSEVFRGTTLDGVKEGLQQHLHDVRMPQQRCRRL